LDIWIEAYNSGDAAALAALFAEDGTQAPPGSPALDRAAIEAALHPAPGKALYFVARGDGTHEFSATLEQHNRAVKRYQLHHRKKR